VNGAIEESTLNERSGKFLPHDEFIYQNLTKDDIVICSLGGNDIALKPSKSTIASILSILAINFCSFGAIKYPWGIGHFVKLFG
jgi:hypothetical protein